MWYALNLQIDRLFQVDNRNFIWLPAFRMLGSFLFLLHLLALFPEIETFWGANALVYPEILSAKTSGIVPTLWDIHQFLEHHVTLSFGTLVRICYYAHILSLVLLCLGLFTRLAAFCALCLHLIWFFSIEVMMYGADFMTTICLFYMVVFPVGQHYSLDAFHRGNWTGNPVHQAFNLTLLQAHFGMAYFFSGLAKALGPTWWNGEAVWKALQTNSYADFTDPGLWADFPVVLQVAGIATVVIELTFPAGIAFSKTRLFFLVGIVLFHLSIGFLLGLYFFSAIMILINLCAYWFPYLSEMREAGKSYAQ